MHLLAVLNHSVDPLKKGDRKRENLSRIDKLSPYHRKKLKFNCLKTTHFKPGADLDESAEAYSRAEKVSHRFSKY